MRVLITGFGPYKLEFDWVNENASWEGVKRMNKEEIEIKHDIQLIVEQMPVDYNEVQVKTSTLWVNGQFDLAIHVGLDKLAKCLRLERQACKGCYDVDDCRGCVPKNCQHPCGDMESYSTALDLETIKEAFNAESPEGLTVEISDNAGKYLCEYIYYTSLHHSETKNVLFVHVPHNKYTYDQLARALECLLSVTVKCCY